MISTKDIASESTGGGLPKTIKPGINTLKINSVGLKRFPFMEADGGYYFVLNVETEPIENFEGFLINKDDESLGRYEGQVGEVKTNRYFYKDGQTKSGIEVFRDEEILKQIRKISIVSTGNTKWLDSVDGKFETIEELVEDFNNSGVFKGLYYNFNVAGKEYERKNGYTGYDLYLPKLTRETVAFELKDVENSKLLPFNELNHWIKLESKTVAEFGDTLGSSVNVDSNSDFEL
jgi:hypothetical protein